jgi:hypothetical protein
LVSFRASGRQIHCHGAVLNHGGVHEMRGEKG